MFHQVVIAIKQHPWTLLRVQPWAHSYTHSHVHTYSDCLTKTQYVLHVTSPVSHLTQIFHSHTFPRFLGSTLCGSQSLLWFSSTTITHHLPAQPLLSHIPPVALWHCHLPSLQRAAKASSYSSDSRPQVSCLSNPTDSTKSVIERRQQLLLTQIAMGWYLSYTCMHRSHHMYQLHHMHHMIASHVSITSYASIPSHVSYASIICHVSHDRVTCIDHIICIDHMTA